MSKGYEVPCYGGCGRMVTQYTFGQQVWCSGCGNRTFVVNCWGGAAAVATANVGPIVIDMTEPQIGEAVVVTCDGPGKNRVGVVSGTRANDGVKRFMVDYEGGPSVEDCGLFERKDIRRWLDGRK